MSREGVYRRMAEGSGRRNHPHSRNSILTGLACGRMFACVCISPVPFFSVAEWLLPYLGLFLAALVATCRSLYAEPFS